MRISDWSSDVCSSDLVASRKAEIRHQIEKQAATLRGHARITDDLLDEVTALVEWPVAITGHFEQRFLELPPEVIVATVETNQRYFTVFSDVARSEEHTSELQSLMRISYAVFCLKKKKNT